MKKILFSLVLLFPLAANAQTTANDLVGLGMSPELADYIASVIPGGAVLSNNVFLKARNQANNADISVLKVDATDDTNLNADTGDTIKFSIAGTTELTLDNDQVTFSGAAAEIVPGATSIAFRNNADSANNLIIADAGGVTIRDTLISAGTSTLGWSVQAAANQACTTTCVTPCVVGINNGQANADIVACSDATADECLCAGAS